MSEARALAVPEVRLDDVWDVVEAVWESLLGRTAAPALPVEVGADWLTAVVTVDGDWRGAVALSCPPPAALSLSRAMLGLAEDETDPEPEDVEDAVREVVNVLGGNVKALVPGGRGLGLPVLVRGTCAVGGDVVGELHVGWPGHQARLVLWRTTTVHQGSTTHRHDDEK